MAGQVIDYAIRSLFALAGAGNIVLATTAETNNGNDILIKILLFMSGIITLLISIFFSGFIAHVVNHSKDRKILFAEIKERLDEIKIEVCGLKRKSRKGKR